MLKIFSKNSRPFSTFNLNFALKKIKIIAKNLIAKMIKMFIKDLSLRIMMNQTFLITMNVSFLRTA